MFTYKGNKKTVPPTARCARHIFIQTKRRTVNPYMEAGVTVLVIPVKHLNRILTEIRSSTTGAYHPSSPIKIRFYPQCCFYHTPTPGPGAA